MPKYYVPDGNGSFIEKGGSNPGAYYVPDGNGAYIEKGIPSGGGGGVSSGELILVIIFGAMMVLTAPFFFGYIGAGLIVGILTGFSTSSPPIIVGFLLFTLVSLIYFVVCGVIYLIFFSKMSIVARFGWAIIAMSVVISPFITMFFNYGNEVFGIGIPVEITQTYDRSPSQSSYVVKNVGEGYQRVSIDNYECFTDEKTVTPNGWSTISDRIIILKPGQSAYFYCNKHMSSRPDGYRRIINGEADQCIKVYISDKYSGGPFRTLCFSSNWQ